MDVLGRTTCTGATIGANLGVCFLAMARTGGRVTEPLVAAHNPTFVRLVARAVKTEHEREVAVADGAATHCVFICVFNAECCTKALKHSLHLYGL